MNFFDTFYTKNYKWYILVPVILFIASLILASFVPKSIDLKGGTYLTIESGISASEGEIVDYLETEFGLNDIAVIKSDALTGEFLEISYITPTQLTDMKSEISAIKLSHKENELLGTEQAKEFIANNNGDVPAESNFDVHKQEMDSLYNTQKNKITNEILLGLHNKFGLDTEHTTIKEIDPVLGESFYKSAIEISIWAGILIVLVIFLFFRELIPSVAVISAAVIDIVGAIAGMTIFNIPLSLTTIPALLMLIGYSVDSDIMLTTKLLKRREGSLRSRAGEAMKTGLTMTGTTLVALVSMLIVSWLTNISVIFYMSAVLLIGLMVDLISTWLMNAPVLLWYLEKKKE